MPRLDGTHALGLVIIAAALINIVARVVRAAEARWRWKARYRAPHYADE